MRATRAGTVPDGASPLASPARDLRPRS